MIELITRMTIENWLIYLGTGLLLSILCRHVMEEKMPLFIWLTVIFFWPVGMLIGIMIIIFEGKL